jgi:ribosomal protein S18
MLSKKPVCLWANIEKRGLFNLLLKYDLYSKIFSLNTRYKNDPDIEIFKSYKKFNDIISYKDIMLLREDINKKEKINPSYYQGYIDE